MPERRPAGPAAALPLIGQTLDGKYELVGILGEGGMGVVFEAIHKRLGQRVAIKLLAPDLAFDKELVARFEREARALARLHSPHVARVMDVDTTPEGLPYMVMELLEGRDLEAELYARTRLPLGESVDIILQACGAMFEAHAAGIVHRDLKPANLFLAYEGEAETRVVKVLDFGLSKVANEATRLTGAGEILGSVLYMSPEQVCAEPNVDMRADIWSLGVILFELLAGGPPFAGTSQHIAVKIVHQDAPDVRSLASVPEGIALTVRRMLDRDRTRRFATLSDVVAALAPFAPPGSMGAEIAERLAMAAPMRTAFLSPKATLPIPSGSRAIDGPAVSGTRRAESTKRLSATSVPVPTRPAPEPAVPPAAVRPAARGARSPARLVLVLAIVVLLLGAAAVAVLRLNAVT